MQQSSNNNDAAKEETLSIDLSALKEALQTVVDKGCAALIQLSKQPVEAGQEVIQKAKLNSKKVVGTCMVSAKEHPIEALLIAFGLGFLVVKILKRK